MGVLPPDEMKSWSVEHNFRAPDMSQDEACNTLMDMLLELERDPAIHDPSSHGNAAAGTVGVLSIVEASDGKRAAEIHTAFVAAVCSHLGWSTALGDGKDEITVREIDDSAETVIADALVAEYQDEDDNAAVVVGAYHIADVALKALAAAGFQIVRHGQ